MTPLARRIARDASLPPRQRVFRTNRGDAPDLAGVVCFEASGIYDLAYQLASDVGRIVGSPAASSLPAPRTWIEWVWGCGRFGVLVEQAASSDTMDVTEFLQDPVQSFFGVWGRYRLRLRGECAGLVPRPDDERPSGWHFGGFSSENLIPAFLVLISASKGAELH